MPKNPPTRREEWARLKAELAKVMKEHRTAREIEASWPDEDPVAAVRWMIVQHLLWAAWLAFALLCIGSLTAAVALR